MTACPLCGGAASPSLPGLRKCPACGLVYKTERYSAPAVYAAGLEEAIYGSAKRELFSGALDFLDGELPARGRLLDIGCAGGELLKAAAARGWLAEGIETDAGQAVKALDLGFEVNPRPVEEALLDGGAYQAATVFDTFSQMDRPAAAAAELFRLLAPGGVIYIREFNAGFHLPLYALELRGFFRPFGLRPSIMHNFNFGARTLSVMLERAGFADVRVRNSRPTAGDPYRTGGLLGGFLTAGLKVLYYYLAQALWVLTLGRVFAGSALIVTARKP